MWWHWGGGTSHFTLNITVGVRTQSSFLGDGTFTSPPQLLDLGRSWNNARMLHKLIYLNLVSVKNSGITLGKGGSGWNFPSGTLLFLHAF